MAWLIAVLVEKNLMETASGRDIVRVQLVPAGAVWQL